MPSYRLGIWQLEGGVAFLKCGAADQIVIPDNDGSKALISATDWKIALPLQRSSSHPREFQQ